jgi:protein gp37
MLSRGGGISPIVGSASEPGTYSPALSAARSAAPSWCDVTWNPTAGCSPVGPGCDHCEALRTVAQLAHNGGKGGARYAGLTAPGRAGPQWTGELRVRDDVLTWPLLQRRGRRILVDSLSDLYHEKLPTEAIDSAHAVMTIAHWHCFLILTRRAERMRRYYADPLTPGRIAARIEHLASAVLPQLGSSAPDRGGAPVTGRAASAGGPRRNWAAGLARVARQAAGNTGTGALEPWPLPNLWLGVAVEDQDRAARIGELLQTPAVMRWACFEPLLGPLRPDLVPVGDGGYVDALRGSRYDLARGGHGPPTARPVLPPLDWVIAGGETGAGARAADPDWVREVRDRCAAAGVPFYFKQWGEWAPAQDGGDSRKIVRRGRRAAGRLIDDRSWDELPAAMRNYPRRPP